MKVDNNQLTDSDLRKVQMVQLEIFGVIKSICDKYHITYSLYSGTLLGAVRHAGFIPWDDDLDICMPRADYERFTKIWDSENHPGYLLQSKDNSPRYINSFIKIRKDHTTFLEHERDIGAFHTGIFVDIFPVDRFPDKGIMKKIFILKCTLNLLFTREFIPPESNGLVKIFSLFLLKTTSRKFREKYRKRFKKMLLKNLEHTEYKWAGTDCLASLKQIFPAGLWDELSLMEFEGNKYPCFSDYDTYLRVTYGDYNKLPPIEERQWFHHPIALDFEHNIDEIENWEKLIK